MNKRKIIIPVIFVFILTMALGLQADDKDKNFYGQFMFGYRMVDTSGAMTKYKEDINLDDGLRLFNFSLHYTPDGALKKIVDRIDLNLYNFGGDPFESFGLSIQKHGKFKFQYNKRKADYFYEDQFAEGGHLYDLHSLNFERVMDSGSFTYSLTKCANVFFSFDRYTKKGDSITTFDINRIEFEYDKPIKEEYNSGSIGLDVHVKNYSFLYEYKVSDYETSNSLFLPGYADGGSQARYPSSLSTFFINQPYKLDSKAHVLKATARPFSNLLLSGMAQFMNQDMDLSYGEQQVGTDYTGRSFEYGNSGKANFERKISNFDFDLTYLVTSKLAVIGAIRKDEFNQSGSFVTSLFETENPFDFNTTGIEAGLQYQLSPKFAATLGYRNEVRKLENLETVLYEEETTRNGYFGNIKWSPSKAFKATFDYQNGSYNDPYTIISPSSYNRMRTTLKWTINKFNVTGSLLTRKTTNDESGLPGWESSKNQLSLRAGYHGAKFYFYGGYSSINVKHEGSRDVAYPAGWSGAAGTFLWDIDYEGNSGLFDLALMYKISKKFKVGGYFNSYKNSGFWEISRTMFKGYIEHQLDSGLVGRLGYRYVDFGEANAPTNDYKANILELSLGYRWK